MSHFYHPTPPPRNPSGFWRGVDDVLEMQEGTRKAADLIFTGHYETPKKGFITEKALTEGWKPPYPDNISLRKITTAQEIKLYRVHVDPDRVTGKFFARGKEITPFLSDPEALRLYLGLPDMPIYITEVNVPANTELLVGRIGPQPSFGLIDKSGFQYQTVERLPLSNFTNTRRIIEPKIDFGMRF